MKCCTIGNDIISYRICLLHLGCASPCGSVKPEHTRSVQFVLVLLYVRPHTKVVVLESISFASLFLAALDSWAGIVLYYKAQITRRQV